MELRHFVILLNLFVNFASVNGLECGQLPHVENGLPLLDSPKNVFEEGTTINFKCMPGYVGHLQYICKDGKWKNKRPKLTCNLKPCGAPGDILHGTFHLIIGDDMVFGARIQYECDEGYQLVGERNYSDCEITGWSGSDPFCEVKSCPPVKNPENGNIIGPEIFDLDQDYPYGSVLKFECNSPALEIKGATEIYCLENRTWSNPVPKCKELECKKPRISNGIVKTDGEVFRYLNEIQYQCNRNHKPIGLQSSTCGQFGWSPQPFCTAITCTITTIENGRFEASRMIFAYQETVKYTCDENYRASGSNIVQCEAEGWVPAPYCAEPICVIPNIHVRIFPKRWTYAINEILNFMCPNANWVKTICTANSWEPPIKCFGPCSPPSIRNSVPSQKKLYNNEESLVVRCDRGYRLRGDEKITCKDGEWSIHRSWPECIRDGCEAPPATVNGRFHPVLENYAEYQQVTYLCQTGYELYGQSHLQCRSKGWPDPPLCIDKKARCRVPTPMVDHGFIISHKGYQLIYACHAGYELEGSDVVVCVNGNWSEPPTCNFPSDPTKSCWRPPTIEHGDTMEMLSPSYKFGDKIQYQCQNYYVLDGNSEIICLGNRWSKPPRCLAPCILTKEDFEKNKILMKWKINQKIDVKHGDRLEFTCLHGFHIEPPSKRYCRDGKMELPQCLSEERKICSSLEYFSCNSCRGDEICVEYNFRTTSVSRPDPSTVLLVAQSRESNALLSVKRTSKARSLKFNIKESSNAVINARYDNYFKNIQFENPVEGTYCLPFPKNIPFKFNITFTGNFSIRFKERSC
ncbi:complement factor H-like [Narcine bancroftii]|uniref:complement factor H-like n=1 Tax=Narcine bancroftii TaxID=1343680 RepID=UPI00383126E2